MIYIKVQCKHFQKIFNTPDCSGGDIKLPKDNPALQDRTLVFFESMKKSSLASSWARGLFIENNDIERWKCRQHFKSTELQFHVFVGDRFVKLGGNSISIGILRALVHHRRHIDGCTSTDVQRRESNTSRIFCH